MRFVLAATCASTRSGQGQHAECAEMMLADPRRMKTDLLGINRLVEDIGDELVGLSLVVFVMVVAQREIAKFHLLLPAPPRMRQLIETASGYIEAKFPILPVEREFVIITRAATVSVEENNFMGLIACGQIRMAGENENYADLIRIKSAGQGMIAKYVGH